MNHFAFRIVGLSAALGLAIAASSARAQIIASDSFNVPGYTVGALNGQAVQGTGFTGNWTQELADDLSVVSPGAIGRPTVVGSQAGDAATFAGGGFSFTTGQVFISYDISNPTAAQLTSTRLDLNTNAGLNSAYLGATGRTQSNFDFITSAGFGSFADAQTNIISTGAHHLVGVLDFANNQIAIFVDPTAASIYNANGANNADGVAVWTPPTTYTALSYTLIDNFSDQATFDNVVFSRDGASIGVGTSAVPEPGSIALLLTLGVTGAGFLRKRYRRK